MTDLEITKLCAEAMGGEGFAYDEFGPKYDPLHDDAQAMALVKKFELSVEFSDEFHTNSDWAVCRGTTIQAYSRDLNRAICECVAKMQAARG